MRDGLIVELGEVSGIDNEKFELPTEEKKRRIGTLRSAMESIGRMKIADPEPPKERIVRKNHDEALNMAQDTFLTTLQFELEVLLKSKVINREGDIRRLKFYKELIHKMFLKKAEIKEKGKAAGLSEHEVFNNLRAQRRIDIMALRNMIEIVEEIIKSAALDFGEDFDK